MILFGTKRDKKNYLDLQKEAFPRANIKRSSRFFDEKVEKKEIFVIKKGNKYLGHLCFGKYLFNPPFARSVFIEELAIKKEFRFHGFGTLLMEKLIKYCQKNKIPSIHLGTNDVSGNKAIKYYERHGFRKVGWLEDIDSNSEYKNPQLIFAIMVKEWKKSP